MLNMFITKKEYERLTSQLGMLKSKCMTLEEDKRICSEEIKNLTEEINGKVKDCQIGPWCEDCAHRKTAVTENFVAFINTFGAPVPIKRMPNYIVYCGKHIHETCPEWTQTKATYKF